MATNTRRGFIKAAAITGAVGLGAAAPFSRETSASAAPAVAPGTTLLNTIQQRGTINIATQLEYPPEMYIDKTTGQPAGYDVELMKMIAKDLNVKLNILNLPFTSIIPALLAGKADLVMVGLENTPKRALSIAFGPGYVPYAQVVIVPANSTVTDVSQLNAKGKVITALLGSTAEDTAKLIFPLATVQGFDQQPALLQVATGRADGCVVELYLAAPFVKTSGHRVKILDPDKPVEVAYGAFGLQMGDQLWLNWIINWYNYYKAHDVIDGLYNRIVGPTLKP